MRNSKNRRIEEPNGCILSRRSVFFLVLWIFGSSIFMSAPAQAAEKVLRHIVMYKFKDDVTPAQLQEVVDTFGGLPKKINTIIGYEAGTNVSTEGKSEGFTHVFVVTFKNEADLAAYLVHPAHEAYVKVVRDRREKVLVLDYWADR
jgi:Stress responsive A/B Barrel Domain